MGKYRRKTNEPSLASVGGGGGNATPSGREQGGAGTTLGMDYPTFPEFK